MTSQGRECAKTDCITDSCPKKRPPKTEDGFCIYYNNGTVRSAVRKERVGGKER